MLAPVGFEVVDNDAVNWHLDSTAGPVSNETTKKVRKWRAIVKVKRLKVKTMKPKKDSSPVSSKAPRFSSCLVELTPYSLEYLFVVFSQGTSKGCGNEKRDNKAAQM